MPGIRTSTSATSTLGRGGLDGKRGGQAQQGAPLVAVPDLQGAAQPLDLPPDRNQPKALQMGGLRQLAGAEPAAVILESSFP
jgi:hypothetical protein